MHQHGGRAIKSSHEFNYEVCLHIAAKLDCNVISQMKDFNGRDLSWDLIGEENYGKSIWRF